MQIVIFPSPLESNLKHMQKTMQLGIFPLLNLSSYEFIFQIAYGFGVKNFTLLLTDNVHETRSYLGNGSKFGIDLKIKSLKKIPTREDLINQFEIIDDAILFIPWNYFLHPKFFDKLHGLINSKSQDISNSPFPIFFEEDINPNLNIPFFVNFGSSTYKNEKKIFSSQSQIGYLSQKEAITSFDWSEYIYSFKNLSELWQLQDLLLNKWSDISNHSCTEIKSGVFFSPGVRLSPKHYINKPVVIGRESMLEENVSLGPNTIVGDNTVIGRKSSIENSSVFKDTIIGEGLEIKDSFIVYNFIYNYKNNSKISIPDRFIIGRINNPKISLPRILELFFTTIYLILLGIPFIVLRLIDLTFFDMRFSKKKIAYLPTNDLDLNGIRNLNQINFTLLDVKYLPLRYYSLLINCILGEIRLVGTSLSTDKNSNSIYPTGIFNLCDVESKESPNAEQRLISDYYYKKMRTFYLDTKIIFLSFFTRIKE